LTISGRNIENLIRGVVMVEWLTLIGAQVTALAGAMWAVIKWREERREDRRVEQNRLAALYVNPFLFASEDLQSRLYNILCGEGLVPLRARPDYPYAEETLYLVAQYFAYEALILRYTQYGTNSDVLRLIQQIRSDFTSAGTEDDVDPWCIFRPRQRALGQVMLTSREDEQGTVMDTISLLEFRELLKRDVELLYVGDAISSLQEAKKADDLPPRTRSRLADVQSDLVDLLEHLEAELKKLTGAESLSLFHGKGGAARRSKARDCDAFRSTGKSNPALPAGDATTARAGEVSPR
jgi:hypothetical protein